MMLTVFSLSLLVVLAVGDLGKCPEPKLADNFDLSTFDTAKEWYLVDGSDNWNNEHRTCVRYTIKPVEGDTRKATGIVRFTTIFGDNMRHFEITTPNHSEPSKLQVTFNDGLFKEVANLSVLHTDEDVIVFYSCEEIILSRIQNIWTLGKKNKLDDQKRLEIYDKIKGLGITHKLREILHKDCPED